MSPIPRSIFQLRYPLLSVSLPFLRSFSSTPIQASAYKTKCTRFLVRQPSPAASRECPTPILFVRAVGLGEGEEEWANWSGMFAEKGYTSVEVDITSTSDRPASGIVWPSPDNPDPVQPSEASSSSSPTTSDAKESPIPDMVAHLNSQIRLMAIPFPPVLIASGASCLLTQAYIEDHPASGLIMLNPPPDEDPRSSTSKSSAGLSTDWKWPTFRYEPRFPILVLSDNLEGAEPGSRIVRAAKNGVRRGGKGVSVETLTDGERGEKSRITAERWLDSCGF